MAHRSDNYLHAFDGLTMNWDAVFGAGFRDAPRGWVTVFRPCAVEEMLMIAREGLAVPAPDLRPCEVRLAPGTSDRFRPLRLSRQGWSRLRSLEASLTPDVRQFPYRRDEAVIEILVNPADGVVCDMDSIAGLGPFADRQERRNKFSGAFRRYWESAVPLKTFLKFYSKIETPEGAHWLKGRRAPRLLPESFFLPEVLVTTPRISPRHVRLAQAGRPQPLLGTDFEWEY